MKNDENDDDDETLMQYTVQLTSVMAMMTVMIAMFK